MKSTDPLVAFDRAIGEVIGRCVSITVCIIIYTATHYYYTATGEPGLEHAMQNIGVNLDLLVLRPQASMVLQGNHIMSTPGIL